MRWAVGRRARGGGRCFIWYDSLGDEVRRLVSGSLVGEGETRGQRTLEYGFGTQDLNQR